jgi:hypothetical protein
MEIQTFQYPLKGQQIWNDKKGEGKGEGGEGGEERN